MYSRWLSISGRAWCGRHGTPTNTVPVAVSRTDVSCMCITMVGGVPGKLDCQTGCVAVACASGQASSLCTELVEDCCSMNTVVLTDCMLQLRSTPVDDSPAGLKWLWLEGCVVVQLLSCILSAWSFSVGMWLQSRTCYRATAWAPAGGLQVVC
jgi:hypothetical protein